MRSKRTWVLPIALALALAAVCVREVHALVYEAPSGNTTVFFGPNFPPPIAQPNQFKSAPATGGGEKVWFCLVVCCQNCSGCPEGSTCGVQFNGQFHVTGSAGTANGTFPLQTACEPCKMVRITVTGSYWGPPASEVSCDICAWCICCVDGNPVTSFDEDYYDDIELGPTPTSPDTYP